jgi:rieske iron-sulfur protein
MLGGDMGLLQRRAVVWGSLLAATRGATTGRAQGRPEAARTLPPQPGDRLVSAEADNDVTPLKPKDLRPGDQPTLAWAFDPARNVARDGTRLNQVLLMRFDPASLGAEERVRSADGVVAFTAICTHQACTVTDWIIAKQVLQCPCHQSQYDPRHGARVVTGPAPRPLPALPLRLADGALVVAASFTDRIGGEQPKT